MSDAAFWVRQESTSPQLDHPRMCSRPARPSHPSFEVFITTPAGKPLYYFAYDETHPAHPRYTAAAVPRPPASVASLAATLTAYQEATYNRVSLIETGDATTLTLAHSALHVAVVSRHRPSPTPLLHALARLALAASNFILSASLADHLTSRPNSRPSFATVQPLLDAALLDAISHPLPYALVRPVALSSATVPSTRRALADLVASAVRAHPDVSHVVVFTTGPPFPPRVVVSCSPPGEDLSELDILLLGVCSAADSPLPAGTESRTVYPQAFGFRRGRNASARYFQLRLHSDHYDDFKRAVGGRNWRPEWTQHPPHTVRLVALSSTPDTARHFLDDLEPILDRAAPVTNLLISMERPLCVQSFEAHGVRDIIVIKDKKRLAGSLGSFCYTAAISTLIAMQKATSAASVPAADASNLMVQAPGRKDSRAFVMRFPRWSLRVVLWDSRFVVLFDLEVSPDDDEAVRVCRDIFVPQLERCLNQIVPTDDRVAIHANTPLAGLLAPFSF